jgi:hypothetical protein
MYFQPLTVADKQLIQSFTLKSSFRSCYLAFASLYCWSGFFNTEFAVEGGRLFLRYMFDDEYVYFTPTGNDGNDEPLRQMLHEATNGDRPFSLQCVDAATCKSFDAIMLEKFEWNVNRDSSEYLYLRSDLENLAGKKFQPKRNHINQFLRTFPDYEYLPLTPEIMPECMALERQWRKNAEAHEPFEAIETIDAEHNALTTAFEHFAELDLIGAAIRANGKIVAFTYGAPINDEVFDICVEKADISILGTYPVINQQFVRRLPSRFIYINREEDLGVPGLRKAKLSYNPVEMVEKFVGKGRNNEQ